MREWSRTVYQTVKNPFIKFCVTCNITSAHISLFNHFITLTFGCWFFSRGEYWAGIIGLLICLANGFLDYLDGDVARETQSLSKIGAWLDSGFDVIVQNIVMGSIGIGCYKSGLPVLWIVLFFIGNAANNFVSFNYNHVFGFDSDKGNELFRELMDKKCHPVNKILKNIIDPTGNYPSLIFYTYRYWIAFGMVFNIMPLLFIFVTIISNIKWVIMYTLFALHLTGEKRLYVLQALAVLDEERDEFYRTRNHTEV